MLVLCALVAGASMTSCACCTPNKKSKKSKTVVVDKKGSDKAPDTKRDTKKK